MLRLSALFLCIIIEYVMKRFLSLYALFLFFLCAKTYAQNASTRITKPDSNFKSIHQYQSEIYAESVKIDTQVKETINNKNGHQRNETEHERKETLLKLIAITGAILLGGIILFFILALHKPEKIQ